MIVVEHNFSEVTQVTFREKTIPFAGKKHIPAVLREVGAKYPNEILIWMHCSLRDKVDFNYIEEQFFTNRFMLSFNPERNFLSDDIGYIEDSPFIKVPKDVRYPTWQMSSLVGCIHTSVINQIWKVILPKKFDFYLNSIAKTFQSKGLFCYSDPKLLIDQCRIISPPEAGISQLFKFVKEHYKLRWTFLLFLNLLIYDRRCRFFSLISALGSLKKSQQNVDLVFTSNTREFALFAETVDVIIPTIGREKYLYNVLCDLRSQTHVPTKVIIVEQNPDLASETSLKYLENEYWPFKIKHIFTHQTGACQARNLAMKYIESKWVFFADDDIRFKQDFLHEALNVLTYWKINASTFNCLADSQTNDNIHISQTTIFGSGCSIVKAIILQNIFFKRNFEFGFGEDLDFGMQLRNQGTDVIFCPSPTILHLKAPIGGFRTKRVFPWEKKGVLPKPAPSIMLFKKMHSTDKQLLGSKTTFFIKYYKKQPIKAPLRYLKVFKKQWKSSQEWANKLAQLLE